MIKRADDIDEGNADVSTSPIARHKPQSSFAESIGKNQQINTSLKQSQSSNSVFKSIKSPVVINTNLKPYGGEVKKILQQSNNTSSSNQFAPLGKNVE